MEELPHSKSCFVCGSRNPSGLKMRFHTDGQSVEGRLLIKPEHAGFVSVAHGGILATILDEIMVWACSVQTHQFFYCAEMTVRYHSPAHPGEEIIATARLVENRKNRIYLADGELKRASGERVASATGKYMPITNLDKTVFAEDFEGTPEQLERYIRR